MSIQNSSFEKEIISGVAVVEDGKVYYLNRPNRHHHVIEKIWEENGNKMVTGEQGFVTNTGRYVDRFEALKIATEAGQLIRKTPPEDRLFSEDVWDA